MEEKPMEEVSDCFRISTEELKEYFNGRRLASFEEYYAFLQWKIENKKRGA